MYTQEAEVFGSLSQQRKSKHKAEPAHLSPQCWPQGLQLQPVLPQMCAVRLTAALCAFAAPAELCYGSSLAALSVSLDVTWLGLPFQPSTSAAGKTAHHWCLR